MLPTLLLLLALPITFASPTPVPDTRSPFPLRFAAARINRPLPRSASSGGAGWHDSEPESQALRYSARDKRELGDEYEYEYEYEYEQTRALDERRSRIAAARQRDAAVERAMLARAVADADSSAGADAGAGDGAGDGPAPAPAPAGERKARGAKDRRQFPSGGQGQVGRTPGPYAGPDHARGGDGGGFEALRSAPEPEGGAPAAAPAADADVEAEAEVDAEVVDSTSVVDVSAQDLSTVSRLIVYSATPSNPTPGASASAALTDLVQVQGLSTVPTHSQSQSQSQFGTDAPWPERISTYFDTAPTPAASPSASGSGSAAASAGAVGADGARPSNAAVRSGGMGGGGWCAVGAAAMLGVWAAM